LSLISPGAASTGAWLPPSTASSKRRSATPPRLSSRRTTIALRASAAAVGVQARVARACQPSAWGSMASAGVRVTPADASTSCQVKRSPSASTASSSALQPSPTRAGGRRSLPISPAMSSDGSRFAGASA
jgi:hypothetical protein